MNTSLQQPTTLYLIRHGEVEWEIHPEKRKLIYGSEVSLSEIGKATIGKLGRRLQNESISKIYASPYIRTQQTADILSDVWGNVPIVTRQNLKDIHFPAWIGLPWSELEKVNYDVYSHPRSEDQETLQAVGERMRKELAFVLQNEPGNRVAVVEHGDPLSLLSYMLRNPEDTSPHRHAFDDGYLERGEAWKFVFDAKGTVIESLILRKEK